jgi:hypothetical protein
MPPSALHADGGRTATRASREHIIERIVRWTELYGEPPSSADWSPSLARWRAQEWRIARYRLGDPAADPPLAWPSLNVVKRRFDGSFAAAVRAAGLAPHRPGPRPRLRAVPGGLPDRPQRGPVAPAALGDEVLIAGAAAREARARSAAAERRAAAAEARAGRAEALLADARRRARRGAERARRAQASRERAVERERGARAAAEARVASAERAAHVALGALASARAAPGSAEPPAGPAVLAEALRALARARAANDPVRLRAALTAVAGAAAGWRARL